MGRFPAGGERIGSDPSQLLEEHRSFLLREVLQQTLIEGGCRSRQRVRDFLLKNIVYDMLMIIDSYGASYQHDV